MEIKPINYSIKCDISGCNNKAEYRIDLRKNLFNSKTHICANCMKEIYNFVSKKTTPKPVKNPYSKPKKLNKE